MSTLHLGLTGAANDLKNADRLWHLQQSGLTDGLSLRELHALGEACRDLIVEKDHVIFHQGDPAEGFFIVNRGTVRIRVVTPSGRQKIVSMLATGRVFGEEAFVHKGLRMTEAIAHEDVWLSVIKRDALMRLVSRVPRLNFNLLAVLNQRLMEAREEIETLSFHSTDRRIARTLLKLSSDHGKPALTAGPFKKLKILLSHEHLAQMIGANRPHVSAIMSEFRKKGMIDYQRRRLLVNEAELLKYAGADAVSKS